MKKVGITTECVCDLPEEYLKGNDVELIYFDIITDTGRFKDGYEITSGNILEYLEDGGKKAETRAPDVREYLALFEKKLEQYDELIHIAVSSHVGSSYQHALIAAERMGEAGKRVTVIDSGHLSTGMGHMVMRAVELRNGGSAAAEIAEAITQMRSKISTTFITRSAESLYRNGRISSRVEKGCAFFGLHPVLVLKNGRISLKMFRIGNYERCVMRYIRGALKRCGQIDNRRLFITHAGCTVRMIAQIRAEAERLCRFDEVIVTRASATVSGNCGPGTVGVLFIHK